jgi:hypothetical protein
MKNSLPLIITLILACALTYAFFTLFEPYEKTIDLGWDKKAQRNPYLAADLFLTKHNINVTSSNDFEKLKSLPDQGMIFISDAGKVLTKKRITNIQSWMEKGGHLVLTAPIFNKNQPDTLLSKFNVEHHKIISKDIDKTKPELSDKKLSEQLNELNIDLKNNTKSENKNDEIPIDEISYLSFNDVNEKLKIHFSPDSSLSHPFFNREDDYVKTKLDPVYWAGNDEGIYFIQFNVGEGLLSIITDNSIWRSDNIDALDHAYFLWLLSESNDSVSLLYGANMPSIFFYIWKYAAEFLMACFIWLVFWLFYRGLRFGKIHLDSHSANRSISEHISASAEYLWRNKKFDLLISPVRSDIFKRAKRLYPFIDNLNQSEKINLISKHSHIKADYINDALITPFNGNEDDFTHIMSYLQKIRNSL